MRKNCEKYFEVISNINLDFLNIIIYIKIMYYHEAQLMTAIRLHNLLAYILMVRALKVFQNDDVQSSKNTKLLFKNLI